MRKSVPLFLRYLAIERNSSELTVKSYREDLLGLIQWLEQTLGTVPTADQLTPQVLRKYQAALQEAGYARTTIARKLASLRSFFRFAQRQGLATDNPAKPLGTPVGSGNCLTFCPPTKSVGCWVSPRSTNPRGCGTAASWKRSTALGCGSAKSWGCAMEISI